MNPLVLSQAEYEAVFERITRLSLDYLATVPERPSFPDVTARDTDAVVLPRAAGAGNRRRRTRRSDEGHRRLAVPTVRASLATSSVQASRLPLPPIC